MFHATSSLLFVADEVTFTITVIIIRMSDQIIKLNESNKYKPASGFGGGMLVWFDSVWLFAHSSFSHYWLILRDWLIQLQFYSNFSCLNYAPIPALVYFICCWRFIAAESNKLKINLAGMELSGLMISASTYRQFIAIN